MGIEIAGIGSLIHLGLNLWAFISIICTSSGTGAKVLWCILVLLCPLLGFSIWFFAGPRANTRTV